MKKQNLLMMLLLLGALALVACQGALPTDGPLVSESEEGAAETLESAEAPVETGAVEKTLYVGPEMVDCEGEGPQTCLLVKEDPNAEYQLFYGTIQGFNYEPGFEYELIVREEPVADPPAGGSSLQWTLVQEVSKTPAGAAEEEVTDTGGRIVAAFVGPELVDCVGVAPQKCMQVKTNPDDEYSLFYDQIEGFTFEEGFEYELRVLIEPVENPPADASALRYTLIEEVSKTAVAVEQPAVGGLETAGEPTLQGPIWRLSNYIDLDGEAAAVLPETRLTISFESDQVNGSSGCNSFFGPYQVDGDALTIGPLGSTMMACLDDVMLQETAYLANLGNVAHYEFVDGKLELSDASFNTLLIYDAEVATALTGTLWNVVGYNNGRGGVTSLVIGTEINATFDEVGVVSGSAGCNSYRATFEADETTIAIGPAATTRKLCAEPEGTMEQEDQFLAAMANAVTYEINGPRMDFYDKTGARQVQFETGEAAAQLPGATVEMPIIVGDADAAEAGAAEMTVPTLAGTSWQWVEMTTPIEVVTVSDPAQYKAEFLDDGTIGIQADCNSGSGIYEATADGAITINITATTLALCPEDSLSDLFIRSLNASARYFDMDGNLFIDMFADAGTMKFEPAP